MQNTLKIAISLPRDDFYKMEKVRKRLRFKRSVLIDEALRFWLKSLEQEELIKRYQQGYRNKPESIQKIKAMEHAAADAFWEEGLR